jgi:hypothetical protein
MLQSYITADGYFRGEFDSSPEEGTTVVSTSPSHRDAKWINNAWDYTEAMQKDARRERDGLIAETDVWALSDRTMTAEQTAYRQALRDITGQSGFPTNITWPTKP